jgi:hypothetical protein
MHFDRRLADLYEQERPGIRDQPTPLATRPVGGASGTSLEPTVQDEAANKGDDSPARCIQGDHAEQQECEHDQGCAALPVAVSPCDSNFGNAD